MIGFLAPPAQTIVRPGQLAGILVEELRRRRVLLPSALVLEAVIRGARSRAERLAHAVLTAGLDEPRSRASTACSAPGRRASSPGCRGSGTHRSRRPPTNVVKLIERVEHVRTLGIDRSRAALSPRRRSTGSPRRPTRVTASIWPAQPGPPPRGARRRGDHARDGADGRHAFHVREAHGFAGRTAERKADERAARSMREVQADLRVLAAGGRALVEAQEAGRDVRQAVEPPRWDGSGTRRRSTGRRRCRRPRCSTPPPISSRATSPSGRSVRRCCPRFAFEGSAAVKDLMAALDLIRGTYAAGKRKLPTSPPLRFVPRRWRPFVAKEDGVDRAGYELCAFSELRERLRAGDVWVAGSRRYRAFDDYLLPRPTFEAMRAAGPLPLAVAERFEDHLAERRARLEEAAAAVAGLAKAGKLTDVRLDKAGLSISPLRAVTPPERRPCGRRSTTACRGRASPRCSWTSTPGPASPTASRTAARAGRSRTAPRCSPACSPTASTSG